MVTKRKTSKTDPAVVVVVDEAPVTETTVELDPAEAEPDVYVLMELHERDGGWWGCAVTFPGGESITMHAPTRTGAEGAAYRIINAKAPTLPVVIKYV